MSPISPIDAATQFIWIVGDPVGQVKAPQVMNPRYMANNENVLVLAVPIAPDHLQESFEVARRMSNLRGWIVTVPHKVQLARWVDEQSDAAVIAGAVNVIRFSDGKTFGDLFDGVGFTKGLSIRGFGIRGVSAFIAGAGGVGSAIALALANEGAARIAVFDVDPARAQGLVARLSEQGPRGVHFEVANVSDLRDFQLLVNASPVGMAGDDRSPIDIALLRPSHTVAEVVMTPSITPLLMAAERRGCTIHPGRQVLDGQLELMLDFFRRPAPAQFKSIRRPNDLSH